MMRDSKIIGRRTRRPSPEAYEHRQDVAGRRRRAGLGAGWPNVWPGTTVDSQIWAGRRFTHLLSVPARVRFLGVEPLPGPLDPGRFIPDPDIRVHVTWLDRRGLMIVGGESGHGARPMHPDWARSIRDRGVATEVPFFFKPWGAWLPGEFGPPPLVEFQDGSSIDQLALPADFDQEKNWDDGLWNVACGGSHVIFVRVGKKRASRLLDGREWNEMPRAEE